MRDILNLHTFSVSKFFVLLSFFGTLAVYLYPKVIIFGLNNYFLSEGNYLVFIVQIFVSNFLHGDFMHFLFNSIFIYYFGSILELLIGRKKYIIFFIFTAIFNAVFISFFENGGSTIGISGFAMALLSYYTLELKSKNNPEWKGGITAIALNVAIGFVPGISLWGHLFGAIAGVIFYFLNKEYFRRKLVGA